MATLQPRQLEAYLDRIQLPTEFRTDERLATADKPLLRQLIAQLQHSIPFENLSLVRISSTWCFSKPNGCRGSAHALDFA